MAVKPKVFVTRIIPEVGLDRIKEHCDAEIWTDPLPPALRRPPPESRRLRRPGVPADRPDRRPALLDAGAAAPRGQQLRGRLQQHRRAAATERGIAVGNTPGVLTDATADMAFCLLIAAARRVVEGHDVHAVRPVEDVGAAGPPRPGPGRSGRSASSAWAGSVTPWPSAATAAGTCSVLYHDVYRNEQAEKELGAKLVDLDTLLRESDFVSLHTDLNEKTRGLFNAERFQKMKRTAVLVNTARGPIVDQKAPYRCAQIRNDLRCRPGRNRPGTARTERSALAVAEPDYRSAHRQCHGRHP